MGLQRVPDLACGQAAAADPAPGPSVWERPRERLVGHVSHLSTTELPGSGQGKVDAGSQHGAGGCR